VVVERPLLPAVRSFLSSGRRRGKRREKRRRQEIRRRASKQFAGYYYMPRGKKKRRREGKGREGHSLGQSRLRALLLHARKRRKGEKKEKGKKKEKLKGAPWRVDLHHC